MAAGLSIGLVEDNDDLRESIMEVLAGQGHRVVGFPSAEDLVEAPASDPFEIVILDLNLPGEDGLSLAARLKRVQPALRVVMMTTRTALTDRVRGYDVGADLYLPKPVAADELLAAVRALGRQLHSDTTQSVLCIDTRSLALRGPQGAVPLNAGDVVMLSALARAPGQRLDYWQLIQALGLDVDAHGKASLAVRVTRLRGKLGHAGIGGDALKSLRASGYQLCVPIEIT